MSPDAVIARQATQIEELRDEVATLRSGIREARSLMVCIGGPLNDDRLNCTKDQRALFWRVEAALPEERRDD